MLKIRLRQCNIKAMHDQENCQVISNTEGPITIHFVRACQVKSIHAGQTTAHFVGNFLQMLPCQVRNIPDGTITRHFVRNFLQMLPCQVTEAFQIVQSRGTL